MSKFALLDCGGLLSSKLMVLDGLSPSRSVPTNNKEQEQHKKLTTDADNAGISPDIIQSRCQTLEGNAFTSFSQTER